MNAKDLAEYCASSPEPEEGSEQTDPIITPDFGILGETLFYSFMPESPDNCISIFDTGGWAKDLIITRKDLTFQFMIRAVDYDSAQELIKKISGWFIPGEVPKSSFYVGTEYIHQVQPMQAAAFPLGQDENGREKFSWNFTFIVH
jgi:hypothetical protein